MAENIIDIAQDMNLNRGEYFSLIIDKIPSVDYLDMTKFEGNADFARQKFEIFIQETSLPGISSPPLDLPVSGQKYTAQGDTIRFNDLVTTIMVSSDLLTYYLVFLWIWMGCPGNQRPFPDEDINVSLLQASAILRIPNIFRARYSDFQFVDIHPTDISDIRLAVDSTSYMSINVTWTYSYFYPIGVCSFFTEIEKTD